MPPRRRVYDEDSEDASEEEPQSEVLEDDELDMDVDEDGEAEEDADGEQADDIDVVGDGTHDDEGSVDDKDDIADEDAEDELIDDVSDAEGLSSPAPTSGRFPTRLKIRLKLPAAGLSHTHTPSRSRRRAAIPRTSDIESEDPDEGEEDEEATTRSTSVATTTAGARVLTARQAVLANVVDSSHVALSEPPNPRKKKPLTEIEIALKREETARKRRNLTEKKLEDEKAETINRLLKKQSRARGKRNALSTAEDRPGPGDAAAEGEEEDVPEAFAPPPTMYRWVSSTRAPSTPAEGEASEATLGRVMTLSFSVPVSSLPPKGEDDSLMDVDGSGSLPGHPPRRLPPAEPPRCNVEGCTALRKYRLVRDFQRGACGLIHLKTLEDQLV